MKKDVYNLNKKPESFGFIKEYFNENFIHTKDYVLTENQSACNLPYDFSPSKETLYNNKEKVNIEISKKYFDDIENITKEYNVSTYSFFLACLYVLLYKYSNTPNISILGLFYDKLFKSKAILKSHKDKACMEMQLYNSLKFNNILDSINKNILSSFPNTRSSNKEKGVSSISSEVAFSYNNYSIDLSAYNINLLFNINYDENTLELIFNKNLFNINTAKSILAHYFFILKQALEHLHLKIVDFSILTDEELVLLEKFNKDDIKINDNQSIFDINLKKAKIYILDKNMLRLPIGALRKSICLHRI